MNDRLRGPDSVPGHATDAPPGSPRKVRVLMERADRRESLFHPGDNMQRLLPLPAVAAVAAAAAADTSDEFDIDLAG